MPVTGVDHLAFPTEDGERLAAFYAAVGFTVKGLEEWRAGTTPIFSIAAGDQKSNGHPEPVTPRRGHPGERRGATAAPGTPARCAGCDGRGREARSLGRT